MRGEHMAGLTRHDPVNHGGAPDRLRASSEVRGEKAKAKARGVIVSGGERRYEPERLAAYRLAREHTRLAAELLRAAETRGYAALVDELRRCAISIPANVKEGYGDHRPKRKAHFYYLAKASVTEAWAHVDTLVDLGLVSPGDIHAIRDAQRQLVAVLVTMIRTQEARTAN
jgi:four helix bundle protein